MRVVVAGASGLIGSAVIRSLVADGHDVVALSRSRSVAASLPSIARVVEWHPGHDATWFSALSGADAVVNLAGTSIGSRPWTPQRKRAIRSSRLAATRALYDAVGSLPEDLRPRVLVNASGMDFYGDRSADEPINEESGPGASFLAGVCVAWEAEAARLGSLGVRVVLLRIGYVIDRNALAFRLLSDPVRLGIGTFLGPGDRPFTWIHLDDVVGLVRLAIQDQAMVGPVNAIAPSPSTLDEVIAAVGRQLGRRIRLRIPGRLLRFVMHDQADLLLHGRTATPRAALTHGYAYLHPTLDDALRTSLDRDRIDPPITSSSPFDRVFSPQDRAGLPAVLHQQYFPTDTVSFTGAMDRVWRRRRVLWPAFRMLSPFRVLFAETGFGVPAKLTVRPTSAGPAQMAVWEREFHFPRSTRHFDGVLAWDHTRQQVVERTGPRGFLESPLRVAVAINAVRIESTATRLRLRGKSVTLPQIVAVRAVVKEWVEMQDPDTIHVVLEISHPLLGPVFGYEGRLTLDR